MSLLLLLFNTTVIQLFNACLILIMESGHNILDIFMFIPFCYLNINYSFQELLFLESLYVVGSGSTDCSIRM